MSDMLAKLGHLSEVSRFRRISEKLYVDGDQIYKDAGINFKASWFSVFFVLARSNSALRVMDVSRQISFSHITVKNIMRELEAEGLLDIQANPADKRSKVIALTVAGKKLSKQLEPLWLKFSSVLQRVFDSGHPDFINILKRIDYELDHDPINERVKEDKEVIRIIDYKPSLKEYFNKLAGKWLLDIQDGQLSADDIFTLKHPDKAYLLAGGFVFFGVYKGEVVGTVALKKMDEDSFELANLFVDTKYRNMGIATRLIERCISRCKENRAEELWLQSAMSMPETRKLYYKFGFKDRMAPLQMEVQKRTEKIMCIKLSSI